VDTHLDDLDGPRKEIIRHVEKILHLESLQLERVEYFKEFMTHLLAAVYAPSGGVYWLRSGSDLELIFQANFPQIASGAEIESKQHRALLLHVLQWQKPVTLRPGEVAARRGLMRPAVGNFFQYWLLLTPIRVNGKCDGLIEIFLAPDRSPAAAQGISQFLIRMSQLAAAFCQKQ
jgi:hypothetical protein